MRPQLEVLEDRIALSIDVTYGGGPTIPHVNVANIKTPNQPIDVDAAMQVMVQQYLPLLQQYYGIGSGTLNASITVSPLSGNSISDAQIQNFIANEIKAGAVPPPGPNQAYFYYLAPGQIVSNYGNSIGGYHWYFMLNGTPVYYAVIYNLQQPDLVSPIESHELAELVTDPVPPNGWYDHVNNEEIADIYQWQNMFVLGGFLMACPSGTQGQLILPPMPPAPPQPTVPTIQSLQTMALEEIQMYWDLALLSQMPSLSLWQKAVTDFNVLMSNPVLKTQQGVTVFTSIWESLNQRP